MMYPKYLEMSKTSLRIHGLPEGSFSVSDYVSCFLLPELHKRLLREAPKFADINPYSFFVGWQDGFKDLVVPELIVPRNAPFWITVDMSARKERLIQLSTSARLPRDIYREFDQETQSGFKAVTPNYYIVLKEGKPVGYSSRQWIPTQHSEL